MKTMFSTHKTIFLPMLAAFACALLLSRGNAAPEQQKAAKPPKALPVFGNVLWPPAPTSEGELTEILTDGNPMLQVREPQTEIPPYEMLEDILPAGGPLRGRLFYMPRLPHLPANQQYYAFRGVGVTGKVNGEDSDVAFYPVTVGATRFFDPLFSADGKRILFKGGWPFERTGSFQLYIWDMAAARLYKFLPPGEEIKYNDISWSPDENYIAYIRGGDAGGNEGQYSKRVQLRIFDLRKGKSRGIAKNRGALSMAWTHQGTLLFTMLPQKKPNSKGNVKATGKEPPAERDKVWSEDLSLPNDDAPEEDPDAPPVPSIYEVPAKGGKAKLLIENGRDAQPSPDGRYIAFLRPPQMPEGKIYDPLTNHDSDLWLYDRKQNSFKRALTDKIDAMLWTPAGRLVVMRTLYFGVPTGGGRGEARINLLNPATLKTRDIKTLEAFDFQAITGRNVTSSQFRLMKFSRDGKYLFVSMSEYVGVDTSTPTFTERMTLQAVPLDGGDVVSVAHILNKWNSVLGWDWHDETGTSVTDITPLTIRAKKQ